MIAGKTVNVLLRLLNLKLIRIQHGIPDGCVTFTGDFRTWTEALNASNGYDAPSILEKVHDAALKVKSGEAAYERDSVLFEQVEYSWPTLAALLWVASQNSGELSVLDFGGSLGTTYYQNKRFLDVLPRVHWGVVEQAHFVEMGRRDMEDEQLNFYYSIEKLLRSSFPPNIALLSCVLQYLENPYKVLSEILALNLEVIVVDILSVIEGDCDRISVEHVPPAIYEASYPAWFFSKSKFIQFVQSKGYEVLEEFAAYVGESLFIDGEEKANDMGFILRKRK